MTVYEMEGFLRGKYIPGDLKVNETNAEYLVRKFGELENKCAALSAENAGLKSGAMDEIKVINRGGQAYCVKDGVQVNPMYARGWNDYRAKSLQSDTPATDAFLSEVRASELDSLAGVAKTMLVKFSNQSCLSDMHEVVGWKMVLQQANNRAIQLRKG